MYTYNVEFNPGSASVFAWNKNDYTDILNSLLIELPNSFLLLSNIFTSLSILSWFLEYSRFLKFRSKQANKKIERALVNGLKIIIFFSFYSFKACSYKVLITNYNVSLSFCKIPAIFATTSITLNSIWKYLTNLANCKISGSSFYLSCKFFMTLRYSNSFKIPSL